MSKVDDLRVKYKKITTASFNFFNDKDQTPTKKYLEYILKIWETQKINKHKLCEYVDLFDKHLSYIKNKDIYDPFYENFSTLITIVDNAINLKNEKEFIKEDHIIVINETKEYLLVSPKTHIGSLKYGANTKWCTASKHNENMFKSYSKGFLVYLIDKTGKRKKNYEKIAFHCSPLYNLNNQYDVFSATDISINYNMLIKNGWTSDEVFEIDMYFRKFILVIGELRKSKEEVESVVNFVLNFDVKTFYENIKKLKIEEFPKILELSETMRILKKDFETYDIKKLLT